ncbi:MAG: septum formation initiator family protein [Gemmatimonadaceae bacterium]|nr:septum formation initiator family protein [Gemmatimonadaceae bacterium]
MTASRPWSPGKIAAALIGVAAVLFAVQGGEYSTTDLLRQRARKKRIMAQIDSLRHTVDSLRQVKHAILTDPAVQERIAREEFGMVRGDKEILYRFAEPGDSVGK